MRIWNIAPSEELKDKTFYFQTSEKNNDGEGKKVYKLKSGDYPLSFNKKGYVYTFKSNGKIYRPFSDNSYYFSKTSDDKYTFESPETEINVSIDETIDDKITINGQTVTAGRDCSTDNKDKGNGLSENLVFSTVVKDKYSVSVEKNSKGELISTFKLLGKGNSKISDSQKTEIEQEVQNSINDALKDLKDTKDINSLSNKTEVTDFGFYVKQMTGKEWLETLSDLGTSVWENATLPENYWNEDKGSKTNNVRMPALFTGVSDGVIGEVTQYPQLIKLGYDVATKEEIREGLWKSVKNISIESIKNASVNFYEEKKANYTSDKSYIVNHTLGQDGVQLASMFFGTGGIKKAVNNLEDGVEKAGKELADKGGELVGKYNWGTAKRYFQHIQEVTGRSVPQNQIDKLKEALRTKEYKKLSPEEYALHTKEYTSTRRAKMIKEWEENTGQKWPIDEKGNRYQLHHIIEQQYGGPNEWWNSHPAKFPDEHQGGIHAKGSPSRELFK